MQRTQQNPPTEAKLLPAAFKRLTPDTELLPLTFLNHKDIRNLSLVSQGMHKAADNEHLWKYLYQRDFGYTPFNFDYRLQYAAHHFHRESLNCSRPDICKILKAKAFQFIMNYKEKPWACYLLGIHTSNSLHKQSEGVGLLKQAFEQKDWRAGKELLVWFVIRDFIPEANLTLEYAKTVFNSLLEAAKKPENISLNEWIAGEYMSGVVTAKNFEAAEQCLEVLFEHDPKSASVLNSLRGCYLRTTGYEFLASDAAKKRTLEKFENFYAKYKLPHIASQIGYLHVWVFKDYRVALQWYLLAAHQGCSSSKYWVGNFYQQGRGVDVNLERAKYWYRRAWLTDRHGLAVEKLAELSDEKESLVWHKRNYLTLGSANSLEKILAKFLQDEIGSPGDIWWLQVGKRKELKILSVKNVFASCALWFIEAQDAVLQGATPPVCTVPQESFEKYIQAGKEEEIWHPVYEMLYREFGFAKDAKAAPMLKR